MFQICSRRCIVLGEAGPGDRPEVANQRWPAQLEQGLHQDQGAAHGQGDGLLLRKPVPRPHPQAEVRRVRLYFQERGLLGVLVELSTQHCLNYVNSFWA